MEKGEVGFPETWRSRPVRERRRIRRLVRMGRPLADRDEAVLALDYARFQRARPWIRFFWVWFVPGMILALGIAAGIHPVLVGAVLALGGQAVFARVNLRRVERVNADLLA